MTDQIASEPVKAHSGWHITEWSCELFGTALLLIGGTLAVVLGFLPNSPIHSWSPGWRRLLTGALFAGSGVLVTISPLGRRSGAHLNPSVSLAFYLNKHSTWADLLGYITAQIIGALGGSALVAVIVPRWVDVASVNYAITHPGSQVDAIQTCGIEAAMTAALILVVFWFVSSRRTARWTPLVVWLEITFFVWWLAPYTGTSLNPARTLAPDVVATKWPSLWSYFVGPLAGAGIACVAWLAIRSRSTLTAKMFHDENYISTMRSELPAVSPRKAS